MCSNECAKSLLAFISRKNIVQVDIWRSRRHYNSRENILNSHNQDFLIIFDDKNKLLAFVSQYLLLERGAIITRMKKSPWGCFSNKTFCVYFYLASSHENDIASCCCFAWSFHLKKSFRYRLNLSDDNSFNNNAIWNKALSRWTRLNSRI